LLVKLARILRGRQEFDEALVVVEQILTIDQSSRWAASEKLILIELVILKKDIAEIHRWQAERAKDPISRGANTLRHKYRDANIPWYSLDVHGDSWKKLPAADRKESQTPPSEAAVRQKLKREIKRLSFTNIELCDVLTFLREYSDVDIQVNWRALGQVGIGATGKISMDHRNITVKHALDLILTKAANNVEQESEPRYLIRGGVLLISTKAKLKKVAQTRPAGPQSQPAEPQSRADDRTRPETVGH